MSLDLLGEGFDLHCGGQDLRFPHHENERAQAVALGKTFANHWMHHGFIVDAEGEKMSKSLGNVSNLLDLIELYDPRAYRLILLQSHYRSPIAINQQTLDAAVASLAGLDAFAARTAGVDAAEPDADVIAAFRAAMDDDLDTPKATALIFDTVRRANAALDAGDAAAAELTAAALRDVRRRRSRPCADRPTCRPTSPSWRPRSTTARAERTSPVPTRSAPTSRPPAGPSRRPKPVRRFAGDRHPRPLAARRSCAPA